jgi:hypothetical protein
LEYADFVGDEFYSDDGTLQNAPTLVEWASLNAEAFHKFGKEISIAKDYKKHMIDAGFKNVREEIYKVRTPTTNPPPPPSPPFLYNLPTGYSAAYVPATNYL